MLKKIFLIFLLILSTNLFAKKNPHVVLETNQGKIELELFADIAPLAVKNFTTHVKNGYYNGVAFHRIIRDFMIQGGDPTETGRGGESIWHKDFKDEIKPNLLFDRPGLLAMANHGPNTNGSQFFITTASAPWLNGKYTIFGKVVGKESIQTVMRLNDVETELAGDEEGRPLDRQEIIKAYIK